MRTKREKIVIVTVNTVIGAALMFGASHYASICVETPLPACPPGTSWNEVFTIVGAMTLIPYMVVSLIVMGCMGVMED